MRIITTDEAKQWCSAHGFAIDRPECDDPRIGNGLHYSTIGKQPIAAAFIRSAINCRPFDGGLVWVLDWPFYEKDEMAVVTRVRASVGDSRWLVHAPAHVFDPDERPDCIGLFNLCSQFRWDALLYVPASKFLAFASHHEIQHISSLMQADPNQLAIDIQDYKLNVVG